MLKFKKYAVRYFYGTQLENLTLHCVQRIDPSSYDRQLFDHKHNSDMSLGCAFYASVPVQPDGASDWTYPKATALCGWKSRLHIIYI